MADLGCQVLCKECMMWNVRSHPHLPAHWNNQHLWYWEGQLKWLVEEMATNSQALRNQHDQLLESKAPIQQIHMLLRRPIQMLVASETLQKSDHVCFFVVVDRSKSFQGEYPWEECCLCLLRLACHTRFFPLLEKHWVYLYTHFLIPAYHLCSSFSLTYFWLLLRQKVVFLPQFLVKAC